jgi:hypothetical protein
LNLLAVSRPASGVTCKDGTFSLEGNAIVAKLDRGRVVRRDDHPHPDPRLVEQLLRKAVRHRAAASTRRRSSIVRGLSVVEADRDEKKGN